MVARLGQVQIDPTSVVARTEHLVLFSRLGPRFQVADLERLLWQERALFEYWVHIVPIHDLPLHRISMRRYPDSDRKRHTYVREWLAANDAFVRYALGELRRRGPLRARDLENRAAEGWRVGGWNDEGQSAPMLLDILWFQGKVMIVGRDGQQRIWDLASRSLPTVPHSAQGRRWRPSLSSGSCGRAASRSATGWGSCSTGRCPVASAPFATFSAPG